MLELVVILVVLGGLIVLAGVIGWWLGGVAAKVYKNLVRGTVRVGLDEAEKRKQT